MIPIGNPGKDAPVFLTGNFWLTVERVKRALKGIDCYLLVANSRGINVWCAATGGHLTHHDVIAAIKVSDIEQKVNHRHIILPQLAATGVEGKVIREKTGWRVVWGPVYARDIPAFLAQKMRKSPEMREVRFPVGQRVEMAVMWAFPFSLIVSLFLAVFWRTVLWPSVGLIWGASLFTFLAFPLYSPMLKNKPGSLRFSHLLVIFDIGRTSLTLWLGFLLVGGIANAIWHFAPWHRLLFWVWASFLVFLLLNIDLLGSTPIFKSGLHEDRFFRIYLDTERCRGAGFCETVCPRNCFQVDHRKHVATRPRDDRCVQCGACIVQCPFDALAFQTPDGQFISPEVIRRFRLNLLGQRARSVSLTS